MQSNIELLFNDGLNEEISNLLSNHNKGKGKLNNIKHQEILNNLLNFPGLSASNVYANSKDIRINNIRITYNTIWRFFNTLQKCHLIETTQEYPHKENSLNNEICYKLSLHGIIYIILTNGNQVLNRPIGALLKNYHSNLLFTLFLYNHIKKETLLKINDHIFTNIIYEYLKGVCNTILQFPKYSKDLKYTVDENDGFLLDTLFIWPNPKNGRGYNKTDFPR